MSYGCGTSTKSPTAIRSAAATATTPEAVDAGAGDAGLAPLFVAETPAVEELPVVLERRGRQVVVTERDVRVLERGSGKVLWQHDLTGSSPLFFDEGKFTVTGLAACKGVARRAQVAQLCGGVLVYLAGSQALLFDVDRATLLVEVEVLPAMIRHPRAAYTEAKIPLGARVLELDGITFM